MYIPLARERVRVAFRDGVFIVVRADYARQRADLILTTIPHTRLGEVPFQHLFGTWEEPELVEADPASDNRSHVKRRRQRRLTSR